MDKTIKYLEEKGFFKRLRTSTKLSEAVFEATGEKCPEKSKIEAYKDIITREISKDIGLLEIILDEVSDEIIKHI